jgi:hypothetical protein
MKWFYECGGLFQPASATNSQNSSIINKNPMTAGPSQTNTPMIKIRRAMIFITETKRMDRIVWADEMGWGYNKQRIRKQS